VLDGLIKIIGIVLLLSTFIAFFMVLFKGPQGNRPLVVMDGIPPEAYLGFFIPLMGWMPTALDLSAWSSLWTIERIKQTGYHPTLKETKLDFNLGYLISSLLALCFINLGAFIMYGTHLSFSMSPAQFSNEVIQLIATHSAIGPHQSRLFPPFPLCLAPVSLFLMVIQAPWRPHFRYSQKKKKLPPQKQPIVGY
jgi:Mn2+/Fe2+ NRAMP family transporter